MFLLLRAIIKSYNQIFITRYLFLQIGFYKVKTKSQRIDTYINNNYINFIKFLKMKAKHRTGRKQKTQKDERLVFQKNR